MQVAFRIGLWRASWSMEPLRLACLRVVRRVLCLRRGLVREVSAL
jgi:hypothetical protein